MFIKNWKLALLALLFFILFTSLGTWQVLRAQQKKVLLQQLAERRLHAPLTANVLTPSGDWRFHQATLSGHFDNTHTLLLDNKTFHGRVGYEVYTPFYAQGLVTPILVDRGFVPLGNSRKQLPAIKAIAGKVTIMGLLNTPPTYVALGQMQDAARLSWPLRVEFINLKQLTTLLDTPLFPYLFTLDPKDPAAYPLEWQAVTMGPERHIGYALQWFALALTLLILFFVLNRRPITYQ